MQSTAAAQRVVWYEPPRPAALTASSPSWRPNEDYCQGCRVLFSWARFRPRHHCRRCGGAFCGACSACSLLFAGGVAARACTWCAAEVLAAPAGVPAPGAAARRGGARGAPRAAAPAPGRAPPGRHDALAAQAGTLRALEEERRARR